MFSALCSIFHLITKLADIVHDRNSDESEKQQGQEERDPESGWGRRGENEKVPCKPQQIAARYAIACSENNLSLIRHPISSGS